MSENRKKVLTIEPDKIPEGTCIIKESMVNKDLKYSICKENGKIKLFPIFKLKESEENG